MSDLEKERETVHNAINTLFDIAMVQKAEIDMMNVDVANKQNEIDSLKAHMQDIWSELDDRNSKEYIIEKCESIIKGVLK